MEGKHLALLASKAFVHAVRLALANVTESHANVVRNSKHNLSL